MSEDLAPSESEIVSAYESRALLGLIFNRDYTDEDSFRSRCVSLHNRGEIDLLSVTEETEFQNIDIHRFFSGQHFFCQAIPELKAPIDRMMRCVVTLVERAGQDGAAGFPNLAFQKWCERDLNRAQEVLAAARTNNAYANQLIAFALVSGIGMSARLTLQPMKFISPIASWSSFAGR